MNRPGMAMGGHNQVTQFIGLAAGKLPSSNQQWICAANKAEESLLEKHHVAGRIGTRIHAATWSALKSKQRRLSREPTSQVCPS